MAIYFIADIKVTDPDAYKEYADRLPPIVRQYGGRHLIRGGKVKQLEGEWNAQRVVVMAFKSGADAKQFALSPEYAPLAEIRHKAGESKVIMVEGVEDAELDAALFDRRTA